MLLDILVQQELQGHKVILEQLVQPDLLVQPAQQVHRDLLELPGQPDH